MDRPIRQRMTTPASPLVLVVEDDHGVRRPLEKFLQMHNFKVVTAETADDAIDMIQLHRPVAAIVDLRLARGSGRDVVVSMPAGTPVIIFSGVPSESAELERLRPRTRLVQKPYSLTMLVEALKEMIEQREALARLARGGAWCVRCVLGARGAGEPVRDVEIQSPLGSVGQHHFVGIVGAAVDLHHLLPLHRPVPPALAKPFSEQHRFGAGCAQPARSLLDDDGVLQRIAGPASDDKRPFVDGKIHFCMISFPPRSMIIPRARRGVTARSVLMTSQ